MDITVGDRVSFWLSDALRLSYGEVIEIDESGSMVTYVIKEERPRGWVHRLCREDRYGKVRRA